MKTRFHPALSFALLLPVAPSLALLINAAWAQDNPSTGMGPNPQLPQPESSWIPTIKVAPAVRWAQGEAPRPAEGLAVKAFAGGLDHPRWIYVLPNGDVLVAETNAPPKPKEAEDGGIRAWVQGKLMARAGARTPSANRITLLRDADGDGVAELKQTFATEGLMSPFGMALIGENFYVANADAVVRWRYVAGQTQLQGKPVLVAPLPGGPINHHWTKSLVANADGSKLYVGVGSNSNVAERGMAAEDKRAAILEIDPASGATRVFASGLRNPVGMAWEPSTRRLWTSVNERDELGDDLVPDYMTSVREGGFYGWPYSYYGQHVDQRVSPPRPDMVAKALVPDYALGSHTASLGLAASDGKTLGARYASGMFVGQHGSWNRKPATGYRVIFVPFAGGKPLAPTASPPVEVLGGFLNDKGEARGRPVGVAPDGRGGLLVADDVGNIIWRVTAK